MAAERPYKQTNDSASALVSRTVPGQAGPQPSSRELRLPYPAMSCPISAQAAAVSSQLAPARSQAGVSLVERHQGMLSWTAGVRMLIAAASLGKLRPRAGPGLLIVVLLV